MMKIDTKTLKFDGAPRFRKVAEVSVENISFANGGERITTRQKGKNDEVFTETVKTAEEGDAIIRRDDLDVYIVDKETFKKMYQIHPDGEKFISRNSGRAMQVTSDTQVEAPWGEIQEIKAGGVLFQNDLTGEVYGNQQHSFEEDFARELINGDLVPLNSPLSDQLTRATTAKDAIHIRDIKMRENFKKEQKRDREGPSLNGSDVPPSGAYLRHRQPLR